MKAFRLGLLSLAVLGVTACSTISDKYGYFKDENQRYKKVGNEEKAVVIPQNLSSKNMQDYYEVPQPGPESSNMQPPLVPPGSYLAKPTVISQQDRIRNAENAKIQGHTVAVTGPTSVGINFSQAWVKVGHVLQAANYKIVEKDNVLGTYYVIDTQSTGGKVKKDMPIYQVHLKAQGNSTMVSVSPSNPGLQNQLNRSLQ